MHILGMVLFTLLVWASGAEAACSGSGLSWSCTAGSTIANVQSAVNSATDGATITFAAGAYTGTGLSLNNRNGITLICVTVGACSFTSSGDTISNDFCSGPKTNLMRISGFNFTGSAGTAKIWLYCDSNMTQVRIDNNTFSIGGSEIAVLLGELSATGKTYGTMDHNTCTGANNFMCLKNISGGTAWTTGLQGSANSFFFEDNVCLFTNASDLGTGCVDVWRANSTVVRFNDFTNGRLVNHSYCHEGPANSEVYLNKISGPAAAPANYRNIHFQGSGEEIAWGNQVEINGNGDTMVIQHFRADPSTATDEGNCNSLADGTVTGSGANASNAKDGNRSPTSTYHGYPAWHQPGRDGNAVLKPVYVFLNRNASGTKVDAVLNSGGFATSHLVANRDYYNAVSANAQSSPTSPFNGTAGVGYGTLANRPTTCTPTSEALDAGNGGVGYWATDQGTWNTSSSNSHGPQVNGADGVLYRCSVANTWTVAYTPYTYPHPLQAGGGGGGGDTTAPVAPTNLRIQ